MKYMQTVYSGTQPEFNACKNLQYWVFIVLIWSSCYTALVTQFQHSHPYTWTSKRRILLDTSFWSKATFHTDKCNTTSPLHLC